mgnify:CR=1 FL=1|uniref:FAD-binding protein n=1 Tax=Candidatus Methanomethylicus mesodigestus TaxID=1867258 RepID=A0A7C3ES43_9CREN
MISEETDVLIVGGGLAGLCAAIASASDLSKTLIVTKTLLGAATTTSMAAGIISAVTPHKDPEDSTEIHYQDTLKGGCYVNDRSLARIMVNDISKYFSRLVDLGIEFEGGEPRPAFIPGHSKSRAYYMKGKGIRLQNLLKNAALGLGCRCLERTLITSLVKDGERVVGAVGYKIDTKEIVTISAKSTILATGGPGELYPRTLMPIGSTGYGCSLALKAGAELVDMEFVQFYPVMVYEDGLPKIFVDYPPLLRNGGDVLDEDGVSVFKKNKIDEPFKLTRDMFSILLAKEMLSGKTERKVYFDCRGIKEELIKSNMILANALRDLESKRVPVKERPFGVSPYAHYIMGGVRVGKDCCTCVPGLYAAGEAVGGPHGANRIGGNAFAAAVAFGFRSGMAASMDCSATEAGSKEPFKKACEELSASLSSEGEVSAQKLRSEVQQLMWEKVGLLRTKEGTEKALVAFNAIREAIPASADPVEKLLLPMMIDTAEAIAISAMIREESRGSHYRTDFPEQSENWKKRISIRLKDGECEVNLIEV